MGENVVAFFHSIEGHLKFHRNWCSCLTRAEPLFRRIQFCRSPVGEATLRAKRLFFSQMVTFDYGMKDRNPIDEVRFYGKSNPDKPLFFRKDEVCCCFSI